MPTRNLSLVFKVDLENIFEKLSETIENTLLSTDVKDPDN